MKAKAIDRKFDQGQDVIDVLNISVARRPLQAKKRITVNLPSWMVQALDREA
jgi:hypothetical protein